jgi:hypothetical protein
LTAPSTITTREILTHPWNGFERIRQKEGEAAGADL